MKNLILLTFIFPFVLISCSKNEDDANNNTTPTTFDNHSSVLMQRMHSMSDSMAMMHMTGDPDYDFAMMMKMHHMAAIDMATQELANGNDSVIKNLSQMMKDAQMMEVQVLDSFTNAHTPIPIMTDFGMKAEHAMHVMDNNADAQNLNGDSDHDFAHLMLPHHQSAMEMAMAIKQTGQNQMIKDMAQEMIEMQQMEINTLQIWLNSNN